MKKLPALFLLVLLFLCVETWAGITLSAVTQPGKGAVTLQWNMINYPGSTAYTLFKSNDGVTWKVSAANPVFRNYTSSTILAYRDNFSDEKKLYYRVKVYDTNANIVDISNTAVVDNPVKYDVVDRPSDKRDAEPAPVTGNRNVWQMYPVPVNDILNLVYRGKDRIRGVINIVIQNATGKTVTRFRAASNNKQIQVPVSNLHAGQYYITIQVMQEVQMHERFIKQ